MTSNDEEVVRIKDLLQISPRSIARIMCDLGEEGVSEEILSALLEQIVSADPKIALEVFGELGAITAERCGVSSLAFVM